MPISIKSKVNLKGKVTLGSSPAAPAESPAVAGAATIVGNAITDIAISDGGSGYLFAPTVTITGAGDGPVRASATISNGEVTDITIYPYSTNTNWDGNTPVITIDPPGPLPSQIDDGWTQGATIVSPTHTMTSVVHREQTTGQDIFYNYVGFVDSQAPSAISPTTYGGAIIEELVVGAWNSEYEMTLGIPSDNRSFWTTLQIEVEDQGVWQFQSSDFEYGYSSGQGNAYWAKEDPIFEEKLGLSPLDGDTVKVRIV